MHQSVCELARTVAIRAIMGVESALQLAVLLVLRARGRHRPMIVPFVGHGDTRRIRIGGRVVLGRSDAAPDPDSAHHDPRTARAVLGRTLALFLTVEVPGAPVEIAGPGVRARVRADRDGYVDATLDVDGDDLAPGWHDYELRLADGATARARVLVVDPAAKVGIVSDVDDTILETGLTRGIEFLRITLMTPIQERAPLPGAADLYRALVDPPGGPQRPIFYVSTSPWNLHGMLLKFIALRRFPLGPLLLTDWGPSHSGPFRIGAQEHKGGLVRRMLAEYPHLGLVLIGDSGQRDPEIYAGLARENPDRIRAVYIRRTRHALAGRIAEVDALAAEITTLGVPMLAVDETAQIAAHATELGLLGALAPTPPEQPR